MLKASWKWFENVWRGVGASCGGLLVGVWGRLEGVLGIPKEGPLVTPQIGSTPTSAIFGAGFAKRDKDF